MFWLRRPRARCGPAPSRNRAVPGPRAAAWLDAHEVVLLHGQPGSPADWQQVADLLPAQLHSVATDRPGYGSSQLPAGGFAANARAVLDDLDSRGIRSAVLVGHSYGGGVALSAASLAPGRVAAVVLLASVGPGCVTVWDRLLAAPGAGQLCAVVAWRLTPWMARARLAGIARRRGRPLRPGEHANWQVWGDADRGYHKQWRTFLTEQRALLRELGNCPTLYRVGPGTGAGASRPQRHRGSLRNRPPTGTRLAGCSPAARRGRGSSPAQASFPEAVADAITAFLSAAQIADCPDRSASGDVNRL